MDHDLAGLIEAHWTNFTIPEIKCYMKQILQGLQYCHSKRVAHRDLKGKRKKTASNPILDSVQL